jgi:glyoxylase-like metal-dependent hydrolase (beta-lactamase superfamily II)
MKLHRLLILLPLLLAACGKEPAPAFKPAEFALKQISERVYVLHGPNELPNPQNRGFMNNPAFVLVGKGVVVIDPGASREVGRLLLAKIAEVTPLPVIGVFNTHIHGDHWLGNQAIKEKFPRAVIYAHAKMKTAAVTDGARWVEIINRLTNNAAKGTTPVAPDLAVEHEDTLKVGDRRFRVYHPGKAHTDGDLMVEVVEDKVLFLGDIVIIGRLGRIDDGLVKGNLAAIDMALQTPARHFVPGHGPSNGREPVAAYRRYLHTLYSEVRRQYEKNPGDPQIKSRVLPALAPFRDWKDFDSEAGRHIGLTVKQVEAEVF